MGKTSFLAIAAIFAVASMATASCSVSDTIPGGGGTGNGGPDPTVVCEEQCVPLHPAGEADYRLLRECTLCGACADACRATAKSVCVNGATESPSACSEIAGQDCTVCVASACALQQDPMTLMFTGVCAPLGQTCSMNTECVVLTTCVADCVALGGTGGGMGVGGMTAAGGMMATGGN